MKIITFEDILSLRIEPRQCYYWVSEMIKNKGHTLLPPKISMKLTGGVFCNVMPSILGDVGGVKMITRYPERKPSLDSEILLYDIENGEFLALIDGNWITAMRTGAVAAHSILLLAKKNFSQMGIIGLGNSARAALLVLAELVPGRELEIKLLRYKGQEELFTKRFSKYSNIHFKYMDNIESVVRDSEVVISAATYFQEDICENECFKEGILVVPIHTRGFGNCDLFFDKVYADDYSHVCDFKYFNQFKNFFEVADVINNKAVGRESDVERILVYNVGISIHDINFAANIYKMLQKNNNIIDVDMCIPKKKFWI